MQKGNKNKSDVVLIANEFGLDVAEVKRVVKSFFGYIRSYSKSLPFNNKRRIFSKGKFDEYDKVFNIPYIGRIGPVYSRYLKWRINESKETSQTLRSLYRHRWSQSELETMAAMILSGGTPSFPEKKKKSELYDTIWVVGKKGKKLAKQVIKKEDVQD